MDNSVKHIGENPPANAVTSPTRTDDKEQDIDRKVRLYGVVEAFRQGRYPSNAQIKSTLDFTVNNSPINESKLSKDGKLLIEDFRAIIATAQKIVEVKNKDELAQNFLYHSRKVDTSIDGVTPPVGKDELNSDGQQAVEHLRTLGKLIFTNSEARKLLKDIGILGRDVAADAAAKVSDVARPDEHELSKVDEPAPSNQWVGPDGQVRSHNEPVPDTGLAAKKEKAKEAAEDVSSQAQDHAQAAGERVANAADQEQQAHVTDEDKANAAADAGGEQATKEAKNAKDKLLAKIPDEHKDKAKEQLHRAKDYANDKFPQERKDRFIYRLKKVVVENQRHRDYQEAIEFFLDRAEAYSHHAQDVSKQGADQGLNVRSDDSFKQAEYELRTLLERFANGQSSQPIFDAVYQLYADAKNDQELSAWFKQLDAYLRRVLQEPGYIMKDSSDKEGRRLMDESKKFWDPKEGKYAGHKDALFDSTQTFFQAYADDPLNVQLGEDVKKFTKDLLMDGDGNLKYKSHLWVDVREVILPALAKHVGYIPIPRVEYTDSTVDVVIENLTLESQNLLPNVFEFEARNYFKVSPYDAIKDQTKHSFWVSFSQIQSDIKNVAFYIKKKSGFPKLKDSGFADVFIGGKGISGKIHVESTGRKDHAFKVVDVKVKIDKLKFAVRDSKYSFLISTFKPLVTGLIKKSVAKAIEEGIRSGLVQLDAQLADISERVDAAKNNDDVNTIDALKAAYNDKKSEAEHTKEKAKDSAPEGKFQITGQRDSKLVDWSSKNSMVEKIGEKQDLATKSSHDWHSPAFDIVGKPTSVPEKAKPVPERSSATPAAGGLVGGLAAGGLGTGAAAAHSHSNGSAVPFSNNSAIQEPTGATSPVTLPSENYGAPVSAAYGQNHAAYGQGQAENFVAPTGVTAGSAYGQGQAISATPIADAHQHAAPSTTTPVNTSDLPPPITNF